MKRTFSLLALLLIAATYSTLQAQTAPEAFTYSFLNRQGTARSIGIGNALGSIGGDFSTLTVNPAGIAIFRRGELSITPSFKFGNTQSTFQNAETDDAHFNFGVHNLSLIAAGKTVDEHKWKGIAFGAGLTRVADFNRSFSYSGNNYQSSQSEVFAYDANVHNNEFWTKGNFYNPSPAWLGYNTYLIDTFGSQGEFISVVDYTKGLNQQKAVTQRGGINELVLSLGANYNEQLMLGVSVGVPFMRYNSTQTFSEKSLSSDIDEFNDYTFTEQLKTRGVGLNAKLGAILVPSDKLRFGVALHTPTFLSINESYNASVKANTENFGGIQEKEANTNTFEYDVITPFRAVMSGAVFFGKSGFFTLDYEWANYASTRFNLNTAANEEAFGAGAFTQRQNELNREIKNTYKASSTVRGGVELRFDAFMVRAGAGFIGSPYKKAETFSTNRMDFSVGAGYRGQHAFVDVGLLHSNYRMADVAYSIPYTNGTISAPKATIQNSLNTLAITVGTKF